MSCLPTIFEFETRTVRSVVLQDVPWFVAADVCAVLQIANNRDAVEKLDDDERAAVALTDTSSNGVVQARQTTVISESGLYTLILRCRGATTPGTLPHRFRKWVTAEVLPTIRRTGSYAPQADQTALNLQLVAECRQTFGTAAAQKLWRKLGLPAVEISRAVASPRPTVDLAARVEIIVRSAADAGLTRTALYRRLDGVCRAAQLDAAVDALTRDGRVTTTRRAGRGRPVVTYRWRRTPTAH